MERKTVNKGKVPFAGRLQNQKGTVLITAVLFLVLLALLGVIATNVTSSGISRTGNYVDSRVAFSISEAGVEHAKSLVKVQDFDDILNGADDDKATTADNGVLPAIGGTVTIDGDPYAQTAFNNGTYSVRIIDNDDGDGDLYADNDGMVYIASLGTINETTKEVHALVRKANLDLGEFPAALTILDMDVDLGAAGNSFTVDGNGVIPDPSPPFYKIDDPTCPDQNAIATTDATPDTADIDPFQNNNFQGDGGGTPNINAGDTRSPSNKCRTSDSPFCPWMVIRFTTAIPL